MSHDCAWCSAHNKQIPASGAQDTCVAHVNPSAPLNSHILRASHDRPLFQLDLLSGSTNKSFFPPHQCQQVVTLRVMLPLSHNRKWSDLACKCVSGEKHQRAGVGDRHGGWLMHPAWRWRALLRGVSHLARSVVQPPSKDERAPYFLGSLAV